MDAREMDLLVEAIAGRVRSRLDGDGGHGCSGACSGSGCDKAEGSCGSCMMPEAACNTCGLNPINAGAGCTPPVNVPDARGMARYIDHTLLKANVVREDIETLCNEAREHGFWSVCVNSANVRLANSYLQNTEVKVCAVVGFPLGASTPGSKAFEAREALRCGANEIDMVMNIGALRSLDYGLVLQDITKVVQACRGKIVKVILETAMLTDREKIIACSLSKVAEASFVKTSTGFGPGGATVEDVRLMRSVVGPGIGVKASGGVRGYQDAVAMLEAGANRLGCSSSINVVTGGASKGSGY